MGAVTLKHVAQAMGVSVTTVSNAYNYPDRLSSELRAKILAKGEELGFCGPGAAGRALRSGRTGAIGVLCGAGYSFAFADPYTLAMFRGISSVLEKEGVALQLLPVGSDENNAEAVSSAVVDAFICLTLRTHSEAVTMAKRRSKPVLFTNVVPDGTYVAIDDVAAGRLMGAHLADLGHERVAVVVDSHEGGGPFTPVTREAALRGDEAAEDTFWRKRLRGIAEAMPGAQFIVGGADHDQDVLVERLDALLTMRPTAIVASRDRLALRLLDALESRGVVAGQHVSLAGFDGTPEALARGLTTVAQPSEEKGREVGRLALDPDREPRQVLLPVQLVIGSTTVRPTQPDSM